MNEELKAKLLTYLAHLEGAVKGTGDFVAEQAPRRCSNRCVSSGVPSLLESETGGPRH